MTEQDNRLNLFELNIVNMIVEMRVLIGYWPRISNNDLMYLTIVSGELRPEY